MLRWNGFDNVAILDAGMAAWTAQGYTLSSDVVSRKIATLSVSLRPELIADRDEVFNAIDDADVVLVGVGGGAYTEA